VHIITGLNTGGAESALYNLLEGGLSTEFDSHVISLSDTGTMGSQIEALGVPVTTLGMRNGWSSLLALLTLRTAIKKSQPDLIQGWMYHGNLAATLARVLFSKKAALVWNIRHSLYALAHEKRTTRYVIRANRFFSGSPDVLLYNSQISRQQHETFGFAASKGKVIPNGINLQKFCFSSDARQRVRTELAIPVEALVIGHVARLHPMKDHPLLLRTLVVLAKCHPSLHFVLSGRGVSLENKQLAELSECSGRGNGRFITLCGDRCGRLCFDCW